MKLAKFLSAITFSGAMMVLLHSCNSDEKKTEETKTDTTAMKHDTPPPAPVKPANILVVMHKVANFSKWVPVFESHDSAQKAAGLTRMVLGRGIDDSNMVLIGFRMSDYDKAKEMAGSAELKATMKKAGVISAPTFDFMNTQVMDTTTNSMLERIIIMSKVKDYDAWKKSYDEHKEARKAGGLTDRGVGYAYDDNHMVTVVLAINDMEKARNFAKSPELKARMDSAGVVGKPTIFFYKVVKQY